MTTHALFARHGLTGKVEVIEGNLTQQDAEDKARRSNVALRLVGNPLQTSYYAEQASPANP